MMLWYIQTWNPCEKNNKEDNAWRAPVMIKNEHKLAYIITLRSRQNGRYFRADNFKHIFSNENNFILIQISQKFVSKSPINNNLAFGSDNGLVTNRWQAIIWTNDGTEHRRIYAASLS